MTPNLSSAGSVCIHHPEIVITVPANALEPDGAMTSTGTVLTTKLDTDGLVQERHNSSAFGNYTKKRAQ